MNFDYEEEMKKKMKKRFGATWVREGEMPEEQKEEDNESTC